jgi:hypothetical protein
VIEAVADKVGERIGDLLDEALVEFGVLALGLELDLLVELARDVAGSD